ncbi:MAG: hypothetical protein WAL29_17900 [Bacteroidales bacterium]
MKKPREIDDPLEVVSGMIRRETRSIGQNHLQTFRLFNRKRDPLSGAGFRKLIISLVFFSLAFTALAPVNKSLVISRPQQINPFASLIYATGMVETLGNNMAYNEHENAVGIFQIRQVRVDDYNRRTGAKYRLHDMFDYSISEKIFLYFASLVGPYDLERIAKGWNGSGPMTEDYWKRIKMYLN